jgi:hypothetical protein
LLNAKLAVVATDLIGLIPRKPEFIVKAWGFTRDPKLHYVVARVDYGLAWLIDNSNGQETWELP